MSHVAVVAVVVVIVLITAATVITMVLGLFRSERAVTPHVADLAVLGQLVESFGGGARWPTGSASRPLARLDFHEYGIRVHAVLWPLGLIMPDWQVRYPDIEGAEPVASSMTTGCGLRLRVSEGDQWIIFLRGGRVDDLLGKLASVDVPVTNDLHRISFWTGRDL